MSFPGYESYKQSDADWLADIPSHWSTVSLRWISRIFAGGTPDKRNQDYWTDGTIPWLNSGSVNQRTISKPSAYITTEAYENSSAKWVPKESLLIALAGQGKTKGMVAQLMMDATCNQSMAAIIPSDELNARFLFWWLNSNYQNIRNMAGGDLRDGLNLEMLGNIPCPVFPVHEQTAIAEFLDCETAKIDDLIAEQQRLIELLKEKRQAVISRSVTKGLNPDAPMKDSGIEWLGNVPAHWEVTKLKYCITKIEQGWSPQCGSDPANENEWGVLKVGCGNGNSFDPSEQKVLPSEIEPRREYEIESGDILMSRGNTLELVGKACFIAEVRPQLLLSDLLYRFRAIPDRAEGRFLVLSLRSPHTRHQIERAATGTSSSMKKIGQGTIRELILPLPSTEEQREIISFVNKQTDSLDSLVVEAQLAIKLLQERRKALISTAVTGKIDVREYSYQETV